MALYPNWIAFCDFLCTHKWDTTLAITFIVFDFEVGTFLFFSELLADSEAEGLNCSGCKHLKDELEHVKEEFERYKLRAQSVLKSKSSKVRAMRLF